MTDLGHNLPLFYLTRPTPCSYLPGKMERKAFTHLSDTKAPNIHQMLSESGFRRSQNIIYRPLCEECNACQSLRVLAQEFSLSTRFKRVMRTNSDVTTHQVDPIATYEHYQLFRQYLDTRHSDGGMANMDFEDFTNMIQETHVKTTLIEYRIPSADPNGELIGVALTDLLKDGLSMVYSFYDISRAERSLGSFMILDHILRAKQNHLKYIYLGYFVEGSAKMGYKKQFTPFEKIESTGWVRVEKN